MEDLVFVSKHFVLAGHSLSTGNPMLSNADKSE